MAGFWTGVPRGAVVRLVGVDRGALGNLPSDAPAVVTWRSAGVITDRAILDELERAAVGLFPSWLPDAQWIDGPGGLGVAAVRSQAHRHAGRAEVHGPFLADLAERALSGRPTSVVFPDAVRATGLARVIAAGLRRPEIALLVDVPAGMSPSAESDMIASCERAASLGQFSVWLIGAALPTAGIRTISVTDSPVRNEPARDAGQPTYPPLAGCPHPGSRVEQLLEAALCRRRWAAGRQWNQTYRIHTLANPVVLDLLWAEERLNVEIDGPEHHEPEHYAADRRRDVDLQLAGYAVLRFTNAEIEHDVGAVVARIERFIHERRRAA